ncbi:threonine--tRNA ligase [Candidatus Woesearchaeota archaeon]|nr:threonine--tRNA ligase [Candidatus Woesearchaeota archaeon]
MLYPYAHLSSALSAPKIAENFLKDAEQLLSTKYKVTRAPFGWYKSFEMKCKGHPLSELSREFSIDNRKDISTEETVQKIEPGSPAVSSNPTYNHLIDLLEKNNVKYRLIDHSPEGRTEVVSKLRGNKLSQAAKCIIVEVNLRENKKKYVLGVVPGDARIKLDKIKELYQGDKVTFAAKSIAEELAGSVSGTVLPLSFNPKMELLVDPLLLENEELYFNAARLDRSIIIKSEDYKRLTKPRLENIADYSEVPKTDLKRESKDEPFIFNDVELTDEQKLKLSAAFIVAKAVNELYPQAELGSCNFYNEQAFVDIANIKLKQEEIAKIEKQAKKISEAGLKIELKSRETVQSITKLQEDIAKDLGAKALFYSLDDLLLVPQFKHPFVFITNKVVALKILNSSSVYWKNNANNPQLTRIYVVGFNSQQGLDNYVKKIEDAENRSHLKLGKEQGLFVISDLVGPGLPLLAPKGMIIRNEIINFLWELHHGKGYQQVWTPHIAKNDLYKTSGHWEKFGDELFKVKGKVDEFVLKPMNCPHHMQIFNNFSFSYRDMPVRFFEPATVYRDEKSGQLVGLSRVRAITQDDGHLFCRISQITAEVKTIVEIIHKFYHTLQMDKDYWVSLSVRGEDKTKYLGSDEGWKFAESALENAAKELKLPYVRKEGEAAFYGPKLDFLLKDALGREWQLATIQCDFNLPERFNLTFMNEKGEKERPVVIHRAISGSLERFMSILIEHFAGKFPLWINPVQVKIITVTDRNNDFAQEVAEKMYSKGLRVVVDDRSETIGKKVREAQMEKVNYIVTIGDKECEAKNLAVRTRNGDVKFNVDVDTFIIDLRKEVDERVIK